MDNRIFLPIVVAAVIVGGGVYLWQHNENLSQRNQFQQQIDNLNNQVNQLSEEKINLQQAANNLNDQVNQLSEEKINLQQAVDNLNNQASPQEQEKYVEIISPNGGESFCVDDELIFSWKVPFDAETVTIQLREGGLSGKTYYIGTFPASLNEEGKKNGEGIAVWKIPEYVTDSMVYKLWVNTVYKGASINDSSDDFFDIQTCEG